MLRRRKEKSMKQKLCLVALTLVLGLAIVKPTAVFATNTKTEEAETKKPQNKEGAERYQESLDKWNKLTDTQKKEVYSIMAIKRKADIDLLDKLVELGVIDASDAKAMKSGLEKMYKQMTEKGEFPIMQPKKQR